MKGIKVDGAGREGKFTSIALDSGDKPHISYYDQSNACLKYAKWTGLKWSIQTVDNPKDRDVGQYTSIALDSGDNPHISYYDETKSMKTPGLNQNLKYAKWTGLKWSIQTVDKENDVGKYTSIALDSGDNPHISYYDETKSMKTPGLNLNLKYAKRTGGTWVSETVDSARNVGRFTSIAVDKNKNPHISYYDQTNGNLKYAKRKNTGWTIETVDKAGRVGMYTSIAVDKNKNPHISYHDVELGRLKYAKWTGVRWECTHVDKMRGVGRHTSIAVDKDNNPHISYFKFMGGGLKYAKWVKGEKGNKSEWKIRFVEKVNSVGEFTSIAVDKNKNPHISYYDSSPGDLKYAK